jgi:[ribosomal protein S18]-alanine N-acetyltransferase
VTAGWRRPDEAGAERADGQGKAGGRGRAGGQEKLPRLRPMVTADLVDVLALEHELFADDPWTPQMFAEEIVQPPESRLYLVAEADADDGGVEARNIVSGANRDAGPVMAGYAGMLFVPGGLAADVLTIAVRESHWGLGIGSVLLDALIQAARERDCAEVFLEVRADNPRAHGLYLRRGFEEIGLRRGYYQPSGADAIVMRKDLLR